MSDRSEKVAAQAQMAAILYTGESVVSQLSQMPMGVDINQWCAKKAKLLWDAVEKENGAP